MTDKPKTELSGGGLVTDDHRELKANGQQRGYLVLSAEERAKGYVRPVRRKYVHTGLNPVMANGKCIKPGLGGCGVLTTMAQDIAETYARQPDFYSGTFCVGCSTHRPLAEFRWDGTDEVVGS